MKEIDKLRAAKEEAAILSEFLDWLNQDAGFTLCKWRDFVSHSDEVGDYTAEGYYPIQKSYEQLLADYFEIDLQKLEQERQEILDNLRKEQSL